MTSPRKPWWQQATALVSLGAGGAITGFAFAPGTADQVASPAGIPVMLTALDQAAQPAPSDDAAVRSAIVSVASYYQRMAQSKTPAQMEALIWQRDSKDGADHGESCAAFASMTLALAAQMVGRQSWVTGGSTYPWPLQDWADVRVDPNPASLGITSVVQDAQAHQRWHPLGDGYQPLPGDWVLFPGHVEVVTKYAGGVLSTVGGDSLPNLSVNAHDYSGPLSAQGVTGFVSNGNLAVAASGAASSPAPAPARASTPAATHGASAAAATQQAVQQPAGALAAVPGAATMTADTAAVPTDGANIPGVPQAARTAGAGAAEHRAPARPAESQAASAARPTAPRSTARQAAAHRQAAQNAGSHRSAPEVAIPGMPDPASAKAGGAIPSATASGHQPAPASAPPSSAPSPSSRPSTSSPASPSASAPASASAPGTPAEQAFINQVAAGAIAAQKAYGVPASVTIAQAIDESAWGQSTLAAQDHNLFGIKGTGPAGSVSFATQEFQNGQWVTISAQFRAYDDVTQSIADHGKLLATSGYYTAAMAARSAPDQFAQALTGVYATNPSYGSDLIGLMQRYNLYRFDAGSQAAPSSAPTPRATASAQPTAGGSAAQAGAGAPRATASAPTTTPATRASAAPGAPVSSPAAKPTAVATAPSPTTPQAASTPAATATPQATPPLAAAPHVAPTPTGTPAAAGSPVPASHAGPPAAPVRGQASPGATPAGRPAAQPSIGPVPHPFATPQTATPQSPAPQARAPQPAAPQGAAPQTAAPQGAAPQAAAPQTTTPSAAATPPDQAAIPGILSTPAATSTHTSAALHASPGTARPRSSSDTQVVAELAAVFRPTAPGGNPAPVTQTASHPAARESAAAAGTSAVKRDPAGQVTGAEEAGEAEGRDRQGAKGRAALPGADANASEERVPRHGQEAARAGRADVPGRGRHLRHLLETAGRL